MTHDEYKAALLNAIDARRDYESSKNAANDSIQSKLTDIRKSVDFDNIAQIMLASNVDANSINRAERSTSRYNVYAFEKVANIAHAIAKSRAINHYTLAIVRTMLALEKAESSLLTHHDAASACSESVINRDKSREKIIRATRYARHVAANTAATQASSSLNALATFNVVRESRDQSNHVVYALNHECDATRELLAIANV